MSTIAILIENFSMTEQKVRSVILEQLVYLADKIILVYIKKESSDFFNLMCTINETKEVSLTKMQKENKKIATILSNLENEIKNKTKKKDLVKVVIIGKEQFKIGACLKDFNVSLVALFTTKQKGIFVKFLEISTYEYITRTCNLPVLILPRK